MKESKRDLRGISNAMEDSANCRDPSQFGDIVDLLGSLSRSMESTELRRLPGWGGYDLKVVAPFHRSDELTFIGSDNGRS